MSDTIKTTPQVDVAAIQRFGKLVAAAAPVFKKLIQGQMVVIKKLLSDPVLVRLARQHVDREFIRRVAARELEIARRALDEHVDGIYRDLGLERPS